MGDPEISRLSLINPIPQIRSVRWSPHDHDQLRHRHQGLPDRAAPDGFRWDQWAALKRADAQVAQAEADYQAAQQDLIERTAQRYFDVLAAQDTVDAAEATLEAFSRQLEQADKRFEVGLIAITDVQETRAAHDQAAAAVIQAKRLLATAQELLRELTGEPFDTLAAPVDDLPLKTPDPENEEQWVTQALEQNLRVISARLATDIAKQDVRVARSGHLPSVDLVATRRTGPHRRAGRRSARFRQATVSPADQRNNDSIGVQVTVPIYSGGGTSSRRCASASTCIVPRANAWNVPTAKPNVRRAMPTWAS